MDELNIYEGTHSGPEIDALLNDVPGKSAAAALAIISNNNTHAAITAGQYVYVYNHNTLSDGLYTANSNISANGTLNTTNMTEVSNGGLNALKSAMSSLVIYGDSLTDLNLAADGYIVRTGNVVCMYILNPTSAMTQNVDYLVGILPQKYVPYDGMNANKYTANGRDYFVTISGGAVKINTPNALPGSGIPNLQVYVSWIAKY